MQIIGDYHMHTPRCKHATGPMEDYVEQALRCGLREIGFSDHNPLPNGLSSHVRMSEHELDGYANDVLQMREQYQSDIKVLLGLELDYLEGLESYFEKLIERHPWDYIIGSVHYLDPGCTTPTWSRTLADNTEEQSICYFDLIRKLSRTGLYDIIAHFDVLKRSGQPLQEFIYPEIAKTLDEIATYGMTIEINTSGYRHRELYEQEPYPSFPIIEQSLERNIPLIVNSDAHAPSHVAGMFELIEETLLEIGCTRLSRFEKRKRFEYPIVVSV